MCYGTPIFVHRPQRQGQANRTTESVMEKLKPPDAFAATAQGRAAYELYKRGVLGWCSLAFPSSNVTLPHFCSTHCCRRSARRRW